MFTGIVEECGRVVAVPPGRLTVAGPLVRAGLGLGDSVAVNGVCLTVAALTEDGFTADVMGETFARSTLGGLAPGDPVNLERAATLASRLGGHLVQGHVDATGTVLRRVPGEQWDELTVGLPAGLARYVVEKGSVAVDGVSLTVTGVTADAFTVGLVPTTLRATTLGSRQQGDRVNLEVDIVAKYVERLLRHAPTGPPAATTETGQG